ncbi:MAG: beta-galactosidase, partial [Prevotella sp.]|nr:beta-galactosidase [Prevotella sp.]
MIRTTLLTLLLSIAMTLQAQNDLFILGGELSNSAATSVADIDKVMPRMKVLGLNTVLVPAYWELLEPTEGQYDFTLIDRTIQQAREQQLKVVFLWFGAWKNSMSCYAPLWFKQDIKRFPRACTAEGKPLEIASCFSDEVFKADNRAFGALMKHISEVGSDVVTMVQVENEIGMLESARDHSPLAEKAYDTAIPRSLYKTLHISRPTTWRQLFGNDIYGEEKFMAYHYAKYVGRLCETARQYTQMPLYVNAAMNSRGRQPGQYPSAGPLAHLIDFWHAGAPQLLCLAPDIYDTGFKSWASQYALKNNRLFKPESRCCEN